MSYDEDGNGRGVAVSLTRDWARWHRPKATRSPGWRSAVLICGLLVLGLPLAGLVHAQAVQVQNTLVSKGVPGDTANGWSTSTTLSSADGRYVVFMSQGANLVRGQVDLNESDDVFLYDRVTQQTVLVSRSATSATTTANTSSDATAISADGEWVLFHSGATNLVSGVTDSGGYSDTFLYQRSTGVVSLVSRSAASSTTTANGGSVPTAISADGEWVLFYSGATNLVSGVTDSNGSDRDVFLYQRSTGAVRLVSRSAASAATTANDYSEPASISPDGEWVLFKSRATNLVSGVTDGNDAAPDVFLYQRSTGVVRLVSRSAASATTTANASSEPTSISADGEWVLFQSSATNLVSGLWDRNDTLADVFLFRRSTGVVSLVSRSATSATMTANGSSFPTAISADGEHVLFQSGATDLVSGVTDSNGVMDVFLYRRSTGALSLVSRSAAAATATADYSSSATAISADGEWVLFQSIATDLVPGVTDSNGEDVFLYQRSTGAMSLISRSATSATTTANGRSTSIAISADGEWVLLQSTAPNLVSRITDSNRFQDVFLYQRSTAALSLVSRSVGSAPTTANDSSFPAAVSADGEWVLFSSTATDLVSGFTDSNDTGQDVFLFQRSTGAVSLVSRSAASATATGNSWSWPASISADGEWVLFGSRAINIVTGVTDSNLYDEDVFLYQRSTGVVSLVSRSAASALTTADDPSWATAISADGEWVLFASAAANLVSGVTDMNGSGPDVYLYQRSTGVVSLITRSAASSTLTANGYSEPIGISADGEWVLFSSLASDLVPGVTEGNGSEDAFLYQRSTRTVSLISRSAASAARTANNRSRPTAISADGEWVLFQSFASDLVPGATDSNWFDDAFLYQRSTGVVSLVSRSAASPTSAASGSSRPTAISADGEWVAFVSAAPDLVLGVRDGPSTPDAFLYQRSTGAVSLMSRSAESPTPAATGESVPTAISDDGEWVLLQSRSGGLVPDGTDRNFNDDVYLYRRSTGAVSLVSRAAGPATTAANRGSTPTAFSGDGKWVLFQSGATNLVSGVLDGNRKVDVVLANITIPDAVFVDGFEFVPPATTAPANAP